MQTFEDVRDPIGVQQVLYQQMEDNENRKFGPCACAGTAGVGRGRAGQAGSAARAGHLSAEEFEAQKARLLQQPPSAG